MAEEEGARAEGGEARERVQVTVHVPFRGIDDDHATPDTMSPQSSERLPLLEEAEVAARAPGVWTTRTRKIVSERDPLAVPQLAVDFDPAAGQPLGGQRMGEDGDAERGAQALHPAHVVRMVVGEPDRLHLAAEPLAGGGERGLQAVELARRPGRGRPARSPPSPRR